MKQRVANLLTYIERNLAAITQKNDIILYDSYGK